MSHSATFHFDGGPVEGHDVIRYNQGFAQGVDNSGQPNTEVYSSLIGIRIASTDDVELAKWMLDPYNRRNARVVFRRIDQNSIFTETKFEEAYCVFYLDNLKTGKTTESSATIDVYLTPRRVIARGVTHDAGWEE